MKKYTLLCLIVTGFIPSFTHPVDVSRDGVTVRVTYEQDKSDLLKSSNLACLYVRIKNDTGALVELPKYGVASALFASEKTLTDLTTGTAQVVARFISEFIVFTCGQGLPSILAFKNFNPHTGNYKSRQLQFCSFLLAITSPITGLVLACPPYFKQLDTNTLLKEYLDRKATTIQIGGEVGLFVFIDLDQYQRSIGKNIIVRVHKKDSDQTLVYEIDATGLLPAMATVAKVEAA